MPYTRVRIMRIDGSVLPHASLVKRMETEFLHFRRRHIVFHISNLIFSLAGEKLVDWMTDLIFLSKSTLKEIEEIAEKV